MDALLDQESPATPAKSIPGMKGAILWSLINFGQAISGMLPADIV